MKRWILVVLLLLAGCGQRPDWHLRNIEGLMPDLAFQLTDSQGRAVTADRFRGKISLLYFGYTHCPDVCPTTLSDLARALRRLGPDADQVRILFVSVDPARDKPGVLGRYAAAFGPQVRGLTGSQDALRQLTRRYRVSFGLGKPDTQGNYEVSHSSAVFVFDRRGRVRLLDTDSGDTEALVADLRRLLKEG